MMTPQAWCKLMQRLLTKALHVPHRLIGSGGAGQQGSAGRHAIGSGHTGQVAQVAHKADCRGANRQFVPAKYAPQLSCITCRYAAGMH